jgi:imidazolonepropionase-like amidohydrolase
VGLTPMQAIVASTGRAAECLGLQDQLGTISAGKAADILVVDGDPVADIRMLCDKSKIGLVIQNGRIVVDRRAKA